MKILDLRPGKNGQTYTVLLDNEEKLLLSAELVMEFSLTPEGEISGEELSRLKEQASLQLAKERAVRSIAASAVSAKSLERRLLSRGTSEKDVGEAIRWLSELDLLNDERTGESIVRTAVAKGYGVMRIRQILREKQIPETYWDALLSQIPPMDDVIDHFLRKKLSGSKPDQKKISAAVNGLLRMGHRWQEIKAGLDRLRMDVELEGEEWL